MTRYYAPTCYANFEDKIEGWHDSLRRALWCHAIKNPCADPLEVMCAKDTGQPRRSLYECERKEIAYITATSPWRLTPQEVREVIRRTKKPPWESEFDGR